MIPTNEAAARHDRPMKVVLAALHEARKVMRQTARGVIAQCPAHDDATPSCSFDEGDSGNVLVKCHAGCSTEAVVAALGLQMHGLFASSSSAPLRPTPTKPVRILGQTPNEAAAALVSEFINAHPKGSLRVHQYVDAEGSALFAVVRFDYRDNENQRRKEVRQMRVVPGGWAAGLGGVERRVLYGLDRLAKADADELVVVGEGEKVVEAARALGFLSTTSSGGAMQAKHTDWSPLRGRRVVVLPDADDAGRQYAKDVATLALLAGAREVRVVELAGLSEGEDLADWHEARRNDREPAAMKAELVRLFDGAEPVKVEKPRSAMREQSIADLLAMPPVEELLAGVLPDRGVAVLAAHPSVGKTACLLSLGLAVAHGFADLWGRRLAHHGAVVYLGLEGRAGLGGRVRAWHKAHGIELDAKTRFPFTSASPDLLVGALLGGEALPLLVAWMRDLRARVGHIAVVIVDTLSAASDGDDENSNAQRAELVRALYALEEASGGLVVGAHHLTKSGRGDSLGDVRGGGALVGNVDQVIGLRRLDNDGPARLSLCPLKARDGSTTDELKLELQVVHTGTFRMTGEPETSVVPVLVTRERLEASADEDRAERLAEEGRKRDELLAAGAASPVPRSIEGWCKLAGIGRPSASGYLVRELAAPGGPWLERPFKAGKVYGPPEAFQTTGTASGRLSPSKASEPVDEGKPSKPSKPSPKGDSGTPIPLGDDRDLAKPSQPSRDALGRLGTAIEDDA